MVDFILSQDAQDDLDQAYNWYEDQQAGLGDEFLEHVHSCFESIRQFPESYACVFKDRRRAFLRRFPYSVFFRLTEEAITIACVFHHSRDPKQWRRRLK